MTGKERFLAIKTYEEYLEKRETFGGLKPDKEILEHAKKIFPKAYSGKEELYKEPPK